MVFPITQQLAKPWVQPETLGKLPDLAANLLWVLTLAGQELSSDDLARATGRSHQFVRQSLARLAGQQLIFRVDRDHWLLAADFRQQLSLITRQKALFEHYDYANEGGEEIERLAHLLDLIGISPPAYHRLLARQDLLTQPTVVSAWWWYYLTKDWPTNRAGLVIKRLENRELPPHEYLALAEVWSQVSAADRAEMEQLLWHDYSASQLSQIFNGIYPQLTVEVCQALRKLYWAAPHALGY